MHFFLREGINQQIVVFVDKVSCSTRALLLMCHLLILLCATFFPHVYKQSCQYYIVICRYCKCVHCLMSPDETINREDSPTGDLKRRERRNTMFVRRSEAAAFAILLEEKALDEFGSELLGDRKSSYQRCCRISRLFRRYYYCTAPPPLQNRE